MEWVYNIQGTKKNLFTHLYENYQILNKNKNNSNFRGNDELLSFNIKV